MANCLPNFTTDYLYYKFKVDNFNIYKNINKITGKQIMKYFLLIVSFLFVFAYADDVKTKDSKNTTTKETTIECKKHKECTHKSENCKNNTKCKEDKSCDHKSECCKEKEDCKGHKPKCSDEKTDASKTEHKCGDGKCNESKCGGDKK